MFDFIDFSKCEYSDRHGTYGGNAGDKDGIFYNDEYWIVKYPKSTRSMKGLEDINYVSSPLSEYIGSHIYEILGIEAHETKLGFRNDKLVVGCKDFCEFTGQLREMRTLKNAAYSELSEKIEQELGHSSTGDRVNLNETLLHLQYNPFINKVNGAIEQFWKSAIIDILIGNNDRNNGNWGILYHPDTKSFSMAPVFDNGNAFYNKMSEEKIIRLYQEGYDKVNEISCGLRTAYDYNDKVLSAKKMFTTINNPDLEKALTELGPMIKSKIPEINEMINEIPNTTNGYNIISDARKKFYCDSIRCRYEHIIEPAFITVKGSNEKNGQTYVDNGRFTASPGELIQNFSSTSKHKNTTKEKNIQTPTQKGETI